ncbi:MAG: tRNA preQ1(34) S-adenosylmethionine ribosyltransferase-isomerase QueA [Oscillospiraceae bacterium]|nr:tRNA preQ1(34) S-adenosylmethionine ribosyltransferase-isomerase QueA [Oscillospiraceae bacterium]
MKTSDFSFHLPKELIAQTPLEQRDASRLLCLNRKSGVTDHRHFIELPDILNPGDCLVMNDSRVIPARLFGRLSTGGAIELVLLRELGDFRWLCLGKPGRKLRPGTELSFGDGEMTATVEEVSEDGNRIVRFHCQGIFMEVLERLGQMPLPPYITEELKDAERYQTVYAKEPGSAAAPTAGLHFTPELLETLEKKGVRLVTITLHVGLGTFRPVKAENIEDHEMHAEYCIITQEAAAQINRTRAEGGRIIAVGTTSCRTLESQAKADGGIDPYDGWTNCFIYPGYVFKCMDGLITNFHLPESTLIMLVSALAGREKVLAAYEEAVEKRYRFFSFGDAMLIL